MNRQPKFRTYARLLSGRWMPLFTGDLAQDTLDAARRYATAQGLQYTKLAVLRLLPGDVDWALGPVDDAAVQQRLVTMYVQPGG